MNKARGSFSFLHMFKLIYLIDILLELLSKLLESGVQKFSGEVSTQDIN